MPEAFKASAFDSTASVSPDWHELTSYAWTWDFYLSDPGTICHAVKIDLKHPDLKINPYPELSSITYPSKRSSLLAKDNDIVINTIPYSQKIPLLGVKKPVGILSYHNLRYSPSNPHYGALSISYDKFGYYAQIYASQDQIPHENTDEILCIQGGFWQILKDGTVIDFKDIKDSRTAVGISKDNAYFYILVVEGENKTISQGLSYNQCGELFKVMGAWNALEFDGGSSTCLYILGKNALSYSKNPALPGYLCFSNISKNSYLTNGTK